jgi:hypothetical protein
MMVLLLWRRAGVSTRVDITHLAPLYSGAKLKYRKGWTLALGQQVRTGRQGDRGLVVQAADTVVITATRIHC